MSTTELSDEEARRVAEFEDAPDAPEMLRERMAEAMWEAVRNGTPWTWLSPYTQLRWRMAADAAIAVMRGEQP
jgi:hypothetical protein